MNTPIKAILRIIKSTAESVSNFSEEMSEAEERISFNLIQIFFLDSRQSIVISFFSCCFFQLLALCLEEAIINNSDDLIHPLDVGDTFVQFPE